MNPMRDFFMSNPSHLFHGMEKAHLETLFACSEEQEFERGSVIFRAGDPAEKLYLIYIGEVAVRVPGYERGDSTIQFLTTGELLGISWIMQPYEYRFDAVAEEDTRLLAFDAHEVQKYIHDDYRFGYELLVRFTGAVAKRLEATRLQMREMAREVTDGQSS